ncbi:DNA mismatch repair protein MSH7 isoform X2 [Rhodamnia argentea]|uniref:DNA mismatch repair protein MSH7 isoform X2 n=1 Tax=Rhodamnia argentea TaxID=178133 RepID=A0A8B8N1W8_9MYRT|nr:DNA mismatch repair protein MSH7 isoform X2 [Rhodamnia argentea]
MQRQKSILSFLRPSSESQSSGLPSTQPSANHHQQNAAVPGKCAVGSSAEVRGTDTPPEKVPRQILRSSDEDGGPSLFSSIMRKFGRVDGGEKTNDRHNSQSHNGTSKASPPFDKVSDLSGHPRKDNDFKFSKKVDRECFMEIESDSDILGPETPGVRPLVPRFKRVQEETPKLEAKHDSSSFNPGKKLKILHDSIRKSSNKNEKDTQDPTSKFEWLDPSRIRDANRRRPDDPLYDKQTLYIPPEALSKMSATQRQYWSVKCQYMDVVLFFKVGKFYELYELDADVGHKELDWKITLSGVGKCRQVGISESGIDDAVQKLVARGYKVGRVEQAETSAQAKARGPNSVISRKLVHVITPSTSVDSNIGPDAVHLLAIKEGEYGQESSSIAYGFAFVDCAALKFWVGSINDDASCAALGALLMQVAPKEVIYESRSLSKEALKAIRKYSLTGNMAVQLTPVMPVAGFPNSSDVMDSIQSKDYFKRCSILPNCALDGVVQHDVALCALGGLIDHMSRLMLDDVLKNGDITPYEVYKGCLRMDGQTLVNLEIFSNSADGGTSGTLYKYLDNCTTCSGKRLLRHWICHPLKDVESINDRLNVIDSLSAQPEVMSLIAQNLRKLPDLERLLGRVKSSVQRSASLLLPLVAQKVLKNLVKFFGSLVKGMRTAVNLLMLLQEERNISSSLSKVFGIPVLGSNNGLDKYLTQFEAAIDSDFPKYQDHDVTDSDAETLSILIELFVEKAPQWSAVVHAINCIDVLRSFTLTAKSSLGASSRPVILPQSKTMRLSREAKGPILKITGLWHPFALGENGGLPVPNDIFLGEDTDGYHPHTLLLTGPNMGGKSTLLRATCLAVILAQLGCYVPCERCILSSVDIIFTRLGATDRIMAGESTFFVECTETASVLQNATEDSLVILDELGRGTSTFDGYAIAYAVFRHLVEKVNCRLLFATHYHPLTKEFGSHPRVTLQHMACALKSNGGNHSKSDQELVFLYKLSSGACPESYGLQVACMAGIPQQVVESASKAGQLMKMSVGKSFKSSEQRLEFSTLHEEWLKTLLSVAQTGGHNVNDDEDSLDTFFCLWHELKSLYPRK